MLITSQRTKPTSLDKEQILQIRNKNETDTNGENYSLSVTCPLARCDQALTVNTPTEEAVKNIVGKIQNAGNQHFLPFLRCCLQFQEGILFFWLRSYLVSASLKFCCVINSS